MRDQVGAGPAHDDLGNNLGADEFVEGLDLFAGLLHVLLCVGPAVILVTLGEEALEIGNAQRGILQVLEQGDQVADVVRAVVQRGGTDQDDLFRRAGAVRQVSLGGGPADALQLVKGIGCVVPELVGLVHDDEVKALDPAHFVEAAVGDDLGVIQAEGVNRLLPTVLHGRGHHDEGMGAVLREPVVEIELLGDEDGDDRLAQPDHVGQEEAAVLFQQAEPAGDRVHLVGEALEALRHVREGVGVVFDAGAEVFQQELEVEIVGRDRGGQIGAVADLLQEFGQDFDGLLPEALELFRGVAHVGEVVEEDVEFVVAAVLVHADARAGEVG